MEKTDVVVKQSVILNLIWDLQRLSLINNVRGRSQIKFGMTSLYNSGFTLIELLVVVLIIGILAAVALPQYQKAVEKSRATEAMMLLKNLRDQQALCFLEKGKVGDCGAGGDETNLLDWAQIEIPDTMEDDGCWLSSCGPVTRDFSYALDGSGLGLNIYAVRHPFATKYALITTADEEGSAEMYNQIACYNWDEDKNWCQVLGLPEVDSLGT